VSIAFRDDVMDQLGCRAEQQRLIDAGIWELAEVTDGSALIYEDGDIIMRVWTWRVL
jgi:hypothetical protein